MSERIAAGDFMREIAAENPAIFQAAEAKVFPRVDHQDQEATPSLLSIHLDRYKHESSGYIGELDASD